MTEPGILAGVFVGGASRRMGGRPKGLLSSPLGERPGETIVGRWLRLFGALGIESVLVGRRDVYGELGARAIDDEPSDIGPLGGLVALLREGGDRLVVVVACDMPYVSSALLERLVFASSGAAALAPKRDGRWEPFFARYVGSRPLELARRHVDAGRTGLHELLHALGAEEFTLSQR